MASEERTEEDAPEFARGANLLLPGVYAWAITVLYPASLRGAGVGPRLAAGLALGALVAGVVLGARGNGALCRAFGLYGFLALSVATWLLLGRLLAVDHLEPIRAALGTVGWALFAFGWGVSREPGHVPEKDPRVLDGSPLTPRSNLPRGAAIIVALAIASAAVPLFFAWRVTRSYHALFAHAVAVVVAIWLATSGAEIGVNRGKWSAVRPVSRRFGQAALSLTLLGFLLLVGLFSLLGG